MADRLKGFVKDEGLSVAKHVLSGDCLVAVLVMRALGFGVLC